MKRKNIVIPLLIVISLAVWSRNIYLVLMGVMQNDQEELEQSIPIDWELPQTVESIVEEKDPFFYKAVNRDPFLHWFDQSEPMNIPTPVQKEVMKEDQLKSKPPELRFSGIVSDAIQPLAVIDGPDGEVYFAHENDSLLGGQIIKIEKDTCFYQFEKERIALPLNN